MPENPHLDALILGAGPGGLAAAYKLAQGGARVAVVERSARAGGLMGAVKKGEFQFDLGRKELYSRFPEVHALWSELLGDDYRAYPHHIGVLWQGRVLEKNGAHQGKLRGLAPAQAAAMAASFLVAQAAPGSRMARSLADEVRLRYGAAYFDAFVRGFQEKFAGKPATELPAEGGERAVPRFALLRHAPALDNGPSQGGVAEQTVWRHPSKGTGQIVESLEREARAAGCVFLLNAGVKSIHVEGGRARAVTVSCEEGEARWEAETVVSSLPLPLLVRFLDPVPPGDVSTPPREEAVFKKSTALVYLMAHGEPKFPHNWIEITDPGVKAGRVVNYGTFNGAMVPQGKTGLCVEYFCVEGDGVMELTNDALRDLAIEEAAGNGLIDRDKIFDTLVIKLPQVNAATEFNDWKLQWMRRATEHVGGISGLLDINRPGTDRATLAGMDAAAAILSGRPMDPRSLQSVAEAVR